MNGFYEEMLIYQGYSEEDARISMRCFNNSAVPIISTLALDFLLFVRFNCSCLFFMFMFMFMFVYWFCVLYFKIFFHLGFLVCICSGSNFSEQSIRTNRNKQWRSIQWRIYFWWYRKKQKERKKERKKESTTNKHNQRNKQTQSNKQTNTNYIRIPTTYFLWRCLWFWKRFR